MRVVDIDVISRFVLRLTFEDGRIGEVDLGRFAGKGVFASWITPGEFESVFVGNGGELCWPNGADLCADALYMQAFNLRPEEVFSSLDTKDCCA